MSEPRFPHPVVRRFIEDAGNLTQSFGLGRVIGQLYAYLYFSPRPRKLDDMQAALGISKGSASTVVRQLEQWGAARRVWVKGDRKDFYEANDWFGRILRNAVADIVGRKLAAYGSLLNGVESAVSDVRLSEGDGDEAFIRDRVEHLRVFQTRAQKLWSNPVVQRLLK